LNSKFFCEIIQACAANGVECFEVLDIGLKISFISAPKVVHMQEISTMSMPQATLDNQAGANPEELEAKLVDPKILEDDQDLQELQITDPLAYEDQLARGEIVNAERASEE
jgi:hypothetical protein